MTLPELSETLIALVGAIFAAEQIETREVELAVPLEISVDRRQDALIVRAAPGHTRWHSGFLPPVHLSHLRITTAAPDRDPLGSFDDVGGWPS